MLKLEVCKQFHAKHNRLKLFLLINEVLKWFGGEDHGVFS
jgi:hypothetical protein